MVVALGETLLCEVKSDRETGGRYLLPETKVHISLNKKVFWGLLEFWKTNENHVERKLVVGFIQQTRGLTHLLL